jgi:hypothetical protein
VSQIDNHAEPFRFAEDGGPGSRQTWLSATFGSACETVVETMGQSENPYAGLVKTADAGPERFRISAMSRQPVDTLHADQRSYDLSSLSPQLHDAGQVSEASDYDEVSVAADSGVDKPPGLVEGTRFLVEPGFHRAQLPCVE